MIKPGTHKIVVFLIILVTCIYTGCTGITKPASFYLLSPLPDVEKPMTIKSAQNTPLITIGPVTLPAYLDRLQMITRKGDNELVLSEFHRWAESLEDNFYRVLMENLSLLLHTIDITTYPKSKASQAEFQIIINVTRFDVDSRGNALLIAYWHVLGNDGSKVLMRKKSVFSFKGKSGNYESTIAALNKTLAALSHEISAAIHSIKNSTALVPCTDPRPDVCTQNYDPVCGLNQNRQQKTYSNACRACSEKEVVGYQPGGPCP